MARTKRQVLLNAAKKQRRHGLMREAAGIIDPPQSWDPVSHNRRVGAQDKTEIHAASPTAKKTDYAQRDLQKSFDPKQKNTSNKGSNEKIETVTSSSSYLDQKSLKRRPLDSSLSPTLGSVRQLKLTARKSTNCDKQAEAEQIIAALMNSPHKTSSTSETLCNSPILPISTSTPKNTARKSISRPLFAKKQRARKSFSENSSFHQHLITNTNDDESFCLKVFPSVHEAVLTLPKSEKLPVALVCIKDVLRTPNSLSVSDVTEQNTPKNSSQRRSEKVTNSLQEDSTPNQLIKSPHKIKTKRVQKNIFDQFESEIKQNPRCSKSRLSGERLKTNQSSFGTGDVCSSTKCPGKAELKGSPKHGDSGNCSRYSGSPEASGCVSNQKTNTSANNTSNYCLRAEKDSKGDTGQGIEKTVRNRSISPRSDSRPLHAGCKSSRTRAVNYGTVLSEQRNDGTSENKSDKCSDQVNSLTDKMSTNMKSDKKMESQSGENKIQSGRCRKKMSSKNIGSNSEESQVNVDSVYTPELSNQCVWQNCDIGPKNETSYTQDTSNLKKETNTKLTCLRNKSIKDSGKLKTSACNSSENQKSGSNLLDLISRVGNRLQDSPSSLDFLNEPHDSHEDSSSSISLNNSDRVDEENSEELSLEVHSSSEEAPRENSVSQDSLNPDNALTKDQCALKSPRSTLPQNECSNSECDKLETDSFETENNLKKMVDDSRKDDNNSASCDKSIKVIEKNCNAELKQELKPIKTENISDISCCKNISELCHESFESSLHSSPDQETSNEIDEDVKQEIKKEDEVSTKANIHKWGDPVMAEPSPLDVLCKPEKSTADKRSAFISDDLDSFLSKAKSESLKQEKIDEYTKMTDISENQEIDENSMVAFEPDFDEIEGVLFLSFANEEALRAHIAVEKQNHWDKDSNYFWGISRYKAFELQRKENKPYERSPVLRNLRGKHMKWKKYRRLLRRELNILRSNNFQAVVNNFTNKLPSKTSDVTKIKGWKKRFSTKDHFKSDVGLNLYASGKIHWRTEARLLRNMKADDIKALGIEIKKKRRKNVIFTNRKRSTRDYENRDFENFFNKFDDSQDITNMTEDDNEDTVLSSGHSSRGSDCEYIYESDHALEDASEFKRLGVVKSASIRKDFVSQFNWDDKDEEILKKLGGRVRNRQKKSDLQDAHGILSDSAETCVSSDVSELPKKKKTQKFIPFVVLSKVSVREAVKALCIEEIQPDHSTRDSVILQSDDTSGTENVSADCSKETIDSADDMYRNRSQDHSKECDKPGHTSKSCATRCRYGCICHLCSSAEEQEEIDVQPHFTRLCDKEYCRLGCICDSLNSQKIYTGKSRYNRQECKNVCVGRQRENISTLQLTDEATVLSDDGDEDSFEDLPPNIDKLESSYKKNSQRTPEKKKITKKKRTDVDPEYKPECESVEKLSPPIEDIKKKTRQPRGDRFGNLPRREQMHRTSKNLDAVTRKAMMLYEMSEIYWEAGERKRRAKEDYETHESKTSLKSAEPVTSGHNVVSDTAHHEVGQVSSSNRKSVDEQHLPDSTALSNSKSKTKSPVNQTKSSKPSRRKSQNIKCVTDDLKEIAADLKELPSSTTKTSEEDIRPALASPQIKTELISGQNKISESSVEPILISDDETSVSVTPSNDSSTNSQPKDDDKIDITPHIWKSSVIKKMQKLTEDLKQKRNELKMKNLMYKRRHLQKQMYSNPAIRSCMRDPLLERKVLQWHTQMVCLKANPKPKPEVIDDDIQEEDEIKLLEFIANCNWDNAKSQVLSRVAQCLNRGVYPNPKKMIVSDYCVEILPKADKPANIPQELREKLPKTMFSIRVKVTRKSDPTDLLHMRAFLEKNSLMKQQLQKSKCANPKIACDSASNRIFNKVNQRPIDPSASIKILSCASTVSETASTQSRILLPSTPVTNSQMTTGKNYLSSSKTENNFGISGLSKLQITHYSTADTSPDESQMKNDTVINQKGLSTRKKKKKEPTDVDCQIVIENAETGAMKPLLPCYSDTLCGKNPSRTQVSNKKKRKHKSTDEISEFQKVSAHDSVVVGNEGNKIKMSKNTSDSVVKDKHCDTDKSFLSYSIENGSLVEKKCLTPASSSDTTITASSISTKQPQNVQACTKPLLLPAPLKGGHLLGPFTKFTDLKFVTIPGGQDSSKTFYQLVSTNGGSAIVPSSNSQTNEYIAIPVTFKDDKNTVLSLDGVKSKTSETSEIKDKTNQKNPAESNHNNSSNKEETSQKNSMPSKKSKLKKKKCQEIVIESTNQIVILNTCPIEDKKDKKEKVKRKRPMITKEMIDGYVDTIAQVAAVGSSEICPTISDKSVEESGQSALAVLLLTDNKLQSTAKTEDHEASAAADNNISTVTPNISIVQENTANEQKTDCNTCSIDNRENLDCKKMQDLNNEPVQLVNEDNKKMDVSSTVSLPLSDACKEQNKETIISENTTTSDTVQPGVENVDPKDSPHLLTTDVQESEASVKRLSETDAEGCSVTKKAKTHINSSSHKLYDLIVNKVAGFPFPEDSESENSMSVTNESLDDCCERISMQMNCEDSFESKEAVSSAGNSSAHLLVQHELTGCSTSLQGKCLRSQAQTQRKFQDSDLPGCQLSKQLTERPRYQRLLDDPTSQSLLTAKCSPELAKMLLSDINQNFDRQQKVLAQRRPMDSSEEIQKVSRCANAVNCLSKVPVRTEVITNNSSVQKIADVDKDSLENQNCVVLN